MGSPQQEPVCSRGTLHPRFLHESWVRAAVERGHGGAGSVGRQRGPGDAPLSSWYPNCALSPLSMHIHTPLLEVPPLFWTEYQVFSPFPLLDISHPALCHMGQKPLALCLHGGSQPHVSWLLTISSPHTHKACEKTNITAAFPCIHSTFLKGGSQRALLGSNISSCPMQDPISHAMTASNSEPLKRSFIRRKVLRPNRECRAISGHRRNEQVVSHNKFPP